jgi:hypothetical protein
MNLYNTTNIKALPPVEQILPGNFLVVEDTVGTKKLNFSDFVIGPTNTSFYTPLDTRIKTLSTSVISLSSETISLSSNLNSVFTYVLELSATLETAAGYAGLTAIEDFIDILDFDTNTVLSLSGDVVSLSGDVVSLSGDVVSLSGEVVNIENSLTKLNNNNNTINLMASAFTFDNVPEGSGLSEVFTSYTSFENATLTLRVFEGQEIALLVPSTEEFTSNELTLIWKLVQSLDRMKILFNYITGRLPGNAKLVNNKPTIAVVPSTCGYGCGYLGFTGIEWNSGFWSDVRSSFYDSEGFFNNELFLNSAMSYEFGRNYWFYNTKIEFDGQGTVATGYAVFMRFFIIEKILAKRVYRFRDQLGDLGDPDYLTFRDQVKSTLKWYQNNNRKFINSLTSSIVPGANFTGIDITGVPGFTKGIQITGLDTSHGFIVNDRVQIANLTNSSFVIGGTSTGTVLSVSSTSIIVGWPFATVGTNGGIKSGRISVLPSKTVKFNNNIQMSDGVLNVDISSLPSWSITKSYSRYDVVKNSDNTAAFYSIYNNNKGIGLPTSLGDNGAVFWAKVDDTTLRPTDVFAAILFDLQDKFGTNFIIYFIRNLNLMQDALSVSQYNDQLIDDLRYFTNEQVQKALDNIVESACRAARLNLIDLFENDYKFTVSNTLKQTIQNSYSEKYLITINLS